MSSKILFDLSRIDPSRIEIPIERIREINPQRHEFEQLDGVFRLLPEEGFIVGYKDVRPDEFWVRGHIPGMPILPGVLMIEAAAQLCSIYQNLTSPIRGFFGFGAVDEVKFRARVEPGDRLILIGKAINLQPRRSIFETQGVVKDRLVFEGQITGISVPPSAKPAPTAN